RNLRSRVSKEASAEERKARGRSQAPRPARSVGDVVVGLERLFGLYRLAFSTLFGRRSTPARAREERDARGDHLRGRAPFSVLLEALDLEPSVHRDPCAFLERLKGLGQPAERDDGHPVGPLVSSARFVLVGGGDR